MNYTRQLFKDFFSHWEAEEWIENTVAEIEEDDSLVVLTEGHQKLASGCYRAFVEYSKRQGDLFD